MQEVRVTPESPVVAQCAPAVSRSPWTGRQVLTDIGACLGIALALTIIFVPFWDLPLRQLAVRGLYLAIVSLSMGFAIKCLYVYVHPRLERRWGGRRWKAVVLHAAVVMAGVAAGGEVAVRIIAAIIPGPEGVARGPILQIGLVVSTIITAIAIAFDRINARAREVELREQRARQEALRAQLEALRARTQPHFLFNSLNTVASLIGEDPELAERALEKLSGLFRYTLSATNTAWVRLEQEIQSVRAYLEVEELRFGERLRFSVDTGPDSASLMVPPLILQPLVENAVLHGLGSRGGGCVSVMARRNGSHLLLRVADDGKGPEGSSHRGSGTALHTLRERLQLVYGGAADLRAARDEDAIDGRPGYLVELRLPVIVP